MDVDKILQRYAAGERSFHKVDWREADLTNISLQGVDFSHADLRQARFGKTDFSQACFKATDGVARVGKSPSPKYQVLSA
ncbi:pentapeptide repeat-containing protein [Gloeocapsa sp. BRSZ]